MGHDGDGSETRVDQSPGDLPQRREVVNKILEMTAKLPVMIETLGAVLKSPGLKESLRPEQLQTLRIMFEDYSALEGAVKQIDFLAGISKLSREEPKPVEGLQRVAKLLSTVPGLRDQKLSSSELLSPISK